MRKAIALLLGALAVAASAWAMSSLHYSSGINGILVTQANTAIPFTDNRSGGSSATFQARHLLLRSRSTSANTCGFDLDGVSTTADTILAPGASVTIGWDDVTGGVGGGWNSIGLICPTGETATWDVDAWR